METDRKWARVLQATLPSRQSEETEKEWGTVARRGLSGHTHIYVCKHMHAHMHTGHSGSCSPNTQNSLAQPCCSPPPGHMNKAPGVRLQHRPPQNPQTGHLHTHRPSSSFQPSDFQKPGFLSSRWPGWVSNCTPGAPAARASGWKATCWARAPESHTAATTPAALGQAMPAPSGQAHDPKTCPNPQGRLATALPTTGPRTGQEAREEEERSSLLEPSPHQPWTGRRWSLGSRSCLRESTVPTTPEPFSQCCSWPWHHLRPAPGLQAQKSRGRQKKSTGSHVHEARDG